MDAAVATLKRMRAFIWWGAGRAGEVDLRPSFLPAPFSCVFCLQGYLPTTPGSTTSTVGMSPGTLPIPSLWSEAAQSAGMFQAWGLQKPLRTPSEPHKGRIWGSRGQSPAKLLTYVVGESTPGGPWVPTGFMWQRGLAVRPSPPGAVLLGH